MNIRHRFGLSLLVALTVLLAPVAAFADSFSMPHVSITADVQPDGSLQVVEERTFDFEDSVNGVFWKIPLGENQQGGSVSLAVTAVSVDGQAYAQDDAAGKGDTGVYAVSESDDVTVKVFSPHDEDTSANVSVSYTLTGAVMCWNDTAELYWKFIGDEWDVDSGDVSLTVTFPAELTAANPAKKGDTLRAWGHGSLSGEVSIDDAASTVSYTLPGVAAGEFAEARIAFPNAWVPQMERAAATQSDRLDAILSEERAWANEANERRQRARIFSYGTALAVGGGSVVLLVVMLVIRHRRKSVRAQFQETYYRDVPEGVHPATVASFMSPGKVPGRAFVATLMKLTDEHVVQIEPVAEKKGDYRLSFQKSAEGRLTNKIDRAAFKTYFDGVDREGENARSRTFKELKRYARKHSESFGTEHDAFRAEVKASVEEANLVANDGTTVQVVTGGLGAILIVAAIVLVALTDAARANLVALVVCLVASIAAMYIGFHLSWPTPEGVELEAKCRALKKWLEEFTNLGEAMPTDLVLWNKLMVMAVALGVSKKALRELATAVPPNVRDADDFYSDYPLYWWWYCHNGGPAAMDRLGSVYRDTVATLSAGALSSGDGGGGGFSGGGGGGVGGGGGGTF